jgi:hypothetical protein
MFNDIPAGAWIPESGCKIKPSEGIKPFGKIGKNKALFKRQGFLQ